MPLHPKPHSHSSYLYPPWIRTMRWQPRKSPMSASAITAWSPRQQKQLVASESEESLSSLSISSIPSSSPSSSSSSSSPSSSSSHHHHHHHHHHHPSPSCEPPPGLQRQILLITPKQVLKPCSRTPSSSISPLTANPRSRKP